MVHVFSMLNVGLIYLICSVMCYVLWIVFGVLVRSIVCVVCVLLCLVADV